MKGCHAFYVQVDGTEFYLFSQAYRKGVHSYFQRSRLLDEAIHPGKAHNDNALIRTMNKLFTAIRYIEREYRITILKRPFSRR